MNLTQKLLSQGMDIPQLIYPRLVVKYGGHQWVGTETALSLLPDYISNISPICLQLRVELFFKGHVIHEYFV